ncbi:helix-turn-helix domain-containing protein [Frankia sp. CiP3]|uniref:helix-turn-helix domain-containing protein n=1 Tax=Frankia sp. CiP3 TaxID=2880971 RepID=UPI001EF3D93E|nr:helix-turn-helix transcriptional regulator [Frankia sp. CiP3]
MGQDPVAAAFGERVRSARLVLGLSQEDLADRAGLHRTYVGSAERGLRNVSLQNIIRLAKALEVTPGQLLDGLEK